MSEGGKCRLPTEAEWSYAASLDIAGNEKKKSSKGSKSDDEQGNVEAQGKIFPVYVNDSKKDRPAYIIWPITFQNG